ncbi:MAG: GntR family transcriptional regulator [Proteobacteria bacterium]|nr:GntR family transcriptional regulator [Pseudomonadota bacterium]
MAQQKYKVVMNTLLREIFQSKLKPGDRLPAERDLSKEMDVDRTSLRIALKQLESMEVLEIRQGDGIYVKNYMKNAGVDFLKMLFLQQEADESEVIIDEYLIDEIMEFWIEFFPLMLKVALRRFAPRDIKQFLDLINNQLKSIQNRKAVMACEIEQMEFVAEKTDNLLYLLISNSTRPLKRKMVELYISAMDDKVLKEYIEIKRSLLKISALGDPENAVTLADGFKKILINYIEIMRKSLHISPADKKIVDQFISSTKAG